ncbi:YbfB/YjiJ family MFS transporter [Aquabacterium sp. A08]|uniref:YbfB/YjiJ family MFS transporter n=1 Tax=Aquabacterium sp. A08 TaxID=2718532 RepID=UPI001421F5EB|nr:YbfB/YjiJ family MFS transporter [Aquabacterium sp. A08]NIC41261.1 YbfB/YjiJ family MFS transporter [Aquabacterium sp. A08]NIC43704.1 YbfB/YjiJ family MFS transporter [Aquabacterium sp. A08]
MSTPFDGSAGGPSTELPGLAWRLALVLSLGAAVSLGVTRFAYGLLLPPMRADLGWSYTLAGAMNTFNALGYLLGALATPWLMRRLGPERLLLWGAALASGFMAGSGFFVDAAPLLAQRLLAGLASAWVFIAGGLLAARLGAHWPLRSGLLLGLYYGGTGWGIVASAVTVPWVLQALADRPHAWAWAWWALAGLCALATGALAWVAGALRRHDRGASASTATAASAPAAPAPVSLWRFTPALAGYTLFGVGYIGYMTFVIALLRDQGHGSGAVTFFYSLLGLAVVASSRIWAGLLDRYKNGQPLARLNALLGLATVLPALTSAWPVLLASGALFGGVFLSVVASTTALVRHNLPPVRWAAGISAFTTVFAAGQIVGPTVVGFIADGPGGLARGLVFSAVALWLGAALAWRQKALV